MMTAEEVLMALCIGRYSDYAVQRDNGSYVRAGLFVSLAKVRAHLDGQLTLGSYLIDEHGLCRAAVFDSDRGLAVLVQLQARLAALSIPSFLELSRRGGHLWVFVVRRVPASLLRRWLLPLCPAEVEFYPKQDEGKSGYGSLMRVPLGVHRLTGQRYPFVTCQNGGAVPVASSVNGVLQWLVQQERAYPPDERTLPPLAKPVSGSPAKKIDNPGQGMIVPAWHTMSLAEWCASQNPYEVIGRYVALDGRGVGCCPFDEHHANGHDRRASFKVYAPARPGGSCWHCYTWGKGGNVFNFLQYYHHVDARTLWARIQAGEAV